MNSTKLVLSLSFFSSVQLAVVFSYHFHVSSGDVTPWVLREGWLFYNVLLGKSLSNAHSHSTVKQVGMTFMSHVSTKKIWDMLTHRLNQVSSRST